MTVVVRERGVHRADSAWQEWKDACSQHLLPIK